MTIEADAFPRFSDEEMARRHTAVRAEMARHELDAIVVYGGVAIGNSPGQVNLTYLARYAAIYETMLVLPADGDATLFEFIPYHTANGADLAFVTDIRSGPVLPNVVARLKELHLERGRIGIIGAGGSFDASVTMPHEQRAFLTGELPDAHWENAGQWLHDLRAVKSEEELAVLRRAGALTDLAHEEAFALTRPGVTHRDLRRAIDGVAVRHGGTFPFNHISSLPTDDPIGFYPECYPTNTPIRAGSMMMTELALGYGNYWAKLWGSYFVGEPPDDYRRAFDVAASIHHDLVAGLRPGLRGREIDRFLDPAREAGLEQPANALICGWCDMMIPPLMGVMESSMSLPFARLFDDVQLRAGNTLTLNVWLRVPGTDKGVWVGSSGAITADGYESFNHYPVESMRIAGG